MEHLRGRACPAAAEPTDGELLERFVTRREDGAFAELVHRHGPMVLSVCRRVLDNAEDVEDAFQATFMILVRKADSIRNRDSLASWLYGVALRVARRARQAMTRRKDRERRAAAPETAPATDEAWRDLRPVLDDAVEALPEKYRVLVVLCYLQGRTYDEASRLLDLAKGTVSTRLTQARTLLRQRLTRRGVVLPLAVLATLLERNAAPAAVPPQLPPLAIEGGRVAAGMGGSVSQRVATLALTSLRGGSLLAPTMVAVLAGALAVMTSGLVIYRAISPANTNTANQQTLSQNWKERFRFKDQPMLAYGFKFSPDGKWWAWQAGDGQVRLGDTETGQKPERIQPAADPARMDSFTRTLGFTIDNKYIVTLAADVRVWEIATPQKETARYPGQVAVLAADGKTLVTATNDGAIHLIDIVDRKDRVIPERLPAPVLALAIHPQGSSVVAGGRDGVIAFFDPSTLKRQRRLPGNAKPTLELAFSPDGSYLAALHGNPVAPGQNPIRAAQVWQLETEQKIDLPPQRVTEIAFAPKGNTLVTQENDGMLSIWDPGTGELKRNFYGGGRSNKMMRLVFSPDGKTIVTGNNTGSAFVRSLETGNKVAQLSHSGMVMDAAFSPNGRLLAIGTSGSSPDGGQTPAMGEVALWER
jgi:RNA polymerase sigma factor (sigma-70 family)